MRALRSTATSGFTLVAETGTPVPGQSGAAFWHFASAPALDGARVVFQGFTNDSLNATGVYAFEAGTSDVLVDLTSTVPGTIQQFSSIAGANPSSDDGGTAFNGQRTVTNQVTGEPQIVSGIYTESAGVLRLIASVGITPIPGGTDLFDRIGGHSIGGNTVAFDGGSSTAGIQGLYADLAGTLERMADTTTPIPGGVGNFVQLGGLLNNLNSFNSSLLQSADDGTVVFAGSGSTGQAGLYVYAAGSLDVLVDTGTLLPDSGTTLSGAGSPAVAGGDVVFVAEGGGGVVRGIYLLRDGSISRLVDNSTIAPGGSDAFHRFGQVSFDGNAVAFSASVGFPADREGIYYLPIGGQITEVIATGDSLDGQTVEDLFFGLDGVNGSEVAFTAVFDAIFPRDEGVYVATIGAPGVPASRPSILIIALLSTGVFGSVVLRQAKCSEA